MKNVIFLEIVCYTSFISAKCVIDITHKGTPSPPSLDNSGQTFINALMDIT